MKLTSGSASRVMWCRVFFLGPVNETLRFTSTTEDFTSSTTVVYLFYSIIFQIGIPSQYIKYFCKR